MGVKWNFVSKYSFSDCEFAKIYKFYVIETPVKGVSNRGRSFIDRKINMTELNNRLKKETPFLKDMWKVVAQKDIEKVCEQFGILGETTCENEIVIHTKNEKHCSGNTDSLFYAIRCAFAHGAYNIHKYKNKVYYALENKDGNTLKGRMIISEVTLLKWIRLVSQSSK